MPPTISVIAQPPTGPLSRLHACPDCVRGRHAHGFDDFTLCTACRGCGYRKIRCARCARTIVGVALAYEGLHWDSACLLAQLYRGRAHQLIELWGAIALATDNTAADAAQ